MPATRSCWRGRSAPARPNSPALSCAPRPATPALEVPSPTFTLVQTYDTRLGSVHHFDLWRLDGPVGLGELGWDEARDDIVLVEWPDRLGRLRPDDALTIALQPVAVQPAAGDARTAVLSGWPDRIGRLA